MSGDAAPCEAASCLVAQCANERGSAAAAVPDEPTERGPTHGNGAFRGAGSPGWRGYPGGLPCWGRAAPSSASRLTTSNEPCGEVKGTCSSRAVALATKGRGAPGTVAFAYRGPALQRISSRDARCTGDAAVCWGRARRQH